MLSTFATGSVIKRTVFVHCFVCVYHFGLKSAVVCQIYVYKGVQISPLIGKLADE